MNIKQVSYALLLCLSVSATASAQGTRLLRHPTVSRDSVAFEYAGDLWVVARSGGQARRLTSTPGVEIDPHFSPDGSQIAFTSTVAGNTDVYVVPTTGGDPKTADLSSRRRSRARVDSRWSSRDLRFDPHQRASTGILAPLDNRPGWGLPEPLPMPRAFSGSYSPDGRRMAYEEILDGFHSGLVRASEWRHYRGGRTHPIRVMNLADYSVEKLPWTNSNDY